MDTGTMIKSLQDPMGVPFFPGVFQALMVLIFAAHIMFVNFALGASFLMVYGGIGKREYWNRLSRSMARATTASFSMAILFGVAPLLFVQVIYDPFWYASNMLSAAWAIGFILLLMLGYSLVYVFYLKRESRGRAVTGFGIAAFVLILLAGSIMHAFGYQLLQPDKWMSWYMQGESVRTSGSVLHAFQLPRLLHFVAPAFALTGVLLMLYAWYFGKRADADPVYLEWVGRRGARMALIFTGIQAAIGVWWLLRVPSSLKFFTSPILLIAAGLGIMLLVLLIRAQKSPANHAVPSMAAAALAVVAMSAAREALRMGYLGRFGYSLFQYKTNLDFGSTALFLGTFAIGLVIIAYLLSIAFKAGRTAGTYEASASMNAWGKLSISLLLAWIGAVVGLGIIISFRNYF